MADKQGFINHMRKHGKRDDSWEDLAKDYGFPNGDSARLAWRREKQKNFDAGIIDTTWQTSTWTEDVQAGKAEGTYQVKNKIESLDDLVRECGIDLNTWDITKYVQNYWGNDVHPHWQVKTWLSRKKEENVFQEEFIKFLETYKPKVKVNQIKFPSKQSKGCLVINKQDSHLNKFDSDGDNDIDLRFEVIEEAIQQVLDTATASKDLEVIVYLVGSDQFNSEWTGCTVKGTPQQNILSYQESFQKICDHEVEVINKLLAHSGEVNVVYMPGNHDEYVGWHMVNWLQAFFKETKRVSFEASPEYTKYIVYSNTAMMFNHGDDAKPEKLAGLFPIGMKDDWSSCDFFYIFTGDKHHLLSKDFNGIEFYQIPALSNAKSKWDKKRTFTTSRAQLTAFFIEEDFGMTLIFKEPI